MSVFWPWRCSSTCSMEGICAILTTVEEVAPDTFGAWHRGQCRCLRHLFPSGAADEEWAAAPTAAQLMAWTLYDVSSSSSEGRSYGIPSRAPSLVPSSANATDVVAHVTIEDPVIETDGSAPAASSHDSYAFGTPMGAAEGSRLLLF